MQFLIAESQLGRTKNRLRQEWEALRADSLTLARQEQLLHRELNDPSASVLAEEKAKLEPLSLKRFEQRADTLRRRAEALMAAASVQVGFAGSGTVLERLAFPLTQAVEEILRHREDFDEQALHRLEGHRTLLLSLVQEGVPALGDEPGPERVAQQADLLKRWRAAEKGLVATLRRLGDSLHGHVDDVKELEEAVQARVAARVQAATAGTTDTQEELRSFLGLRRAGKRSAEFHAERVLELLDRSKAGDAAGEGRRYSIQRIWNTWFKAGSTGRVGTGVILVPILVGLVSGWAAVAAQNQSTTAFGRTLTGDQPLAELRIFGDPAQVPDYAVPPLGEDHPSNAETLTLGYIRDRMQRSADREDIALLPDHLELTVALLPIDDYVDYQPHSEYDHRIVIDYWDLLEAYQEIRQDIADQYPEVINSATGEIELGQAILPVWLFDDDSYAPGLPLTGEISAGVDSRLGQYYFVATEPVRRNLQDDGSSIPLGSMVAYDLQELGRTMEYNHQVAADVSPQALFWAGAIAGWTGSQAALLVLVAAVQALSQVVGSRAARRQLAVVRDRLNQLALGLDLSRIDMVAVLGGEDGHYGEAAEADQRLYEAALVTAWREVQVLESLPRRQQRGPQWASRVAQMDRLVASLSERDVDVAQRALALLRS
ncbi:hypothetical protein [Nesterenkonia alkaliphila]|nr:hypothetical protein [Nesterenkonia alkaliphila]GFZ79657.1 hypothetical protein GCM10011359_04970 [Nesterenkonia alkaliphila]